jgi:hypothetical protein
LKEIEEMKQDLKQKEEAIIVYQQMLDNWTIKFKDLMDKQKVIILNLDYNDVPTNNNEEDT